MLLCFIALALAGVALAGGGTTIANASTISFGVQYFGNTATGCRGNPGYSDYECHEFWKVPLIAGDTLTVKFENASGSPNLGVGQLRLYKAGTDDFDYSDAEHWSESISSNAHGQLVQTAPTTGVYPLDFCAQCSWGVDSGAYDFTAYVRHAVRLQANASTLRYRGTWTVRVLYADGSPVNDSSLSLKLYAKLGRSWKAVGKGTVSSGKAAVKYALPRSTRKHVVRLRLSASGGAFKSATVTRSVRIR